MNTLRPVLLALLLSSCAIFVGCGAPSAAPASQEPAREESTDSESEGGDTLEPTGITPPPDDGPPGWNSPTAPYGGD